MYVCTSRSSPGRKEFPGSCLKGPVGKPADPLVQKSVGPRMNLRILCSSQKSTSSKSRNKSITTDIYSEDCFAPSDRHTYTRLFNEVGSNVGGNTRQLKLVSANLVRPLSTELPNRPKFIEKSSAWFGYLDETANVSLNPLLGSVGA